MMLGRLGYRSRRSTDKSRGGIMRSSVRRVANFNAESRHTIVRLAVSSLVYQVDKVHRPPGMKPVAPGNGVSSP